MAKTEHHRPRRLRRRLGIREGAPVAPRALLITFVSGLSVSAALAFGLRATGRAWFDIPNSLSTLTTGTLVVSVLMPVLGNSFGFFVAYRRPHHRSLLLFLAPGAVLVAFGMTILLVKLPSSPSTASILTTIAVALIPTAVIVPLLLRLRSARHAVYHTGERST